MGLMRNFGFRGYGNVIYIGTSGKMMEVCAAMGLTSLESVDEFIETNRRNHSAYQRELRGIPGLSMISYDERERANYQYVVLEVDEQVAGLPHAALVLPETERLCHRVVLLPNGTGVDEPAISQICRVIRTAVAS